MSTNGEKVECLEGCIVELEQERDFLREKIKGYRARIKRNKERIKDINKCRGIHREIIDDELVT